MAAQKATEMRREHFHQFQADQAALRLRQEELEKLLLAAPAQSWPEAAAKAQYPIQLFADTPEGQDPRRKELIAHAMRSEEHTSELQSLMRTSYAVFCLKKKTTHKHNKQ